ARRNVCTGRSRGIRKQRPLTQPRSLPLCKLLPNLSPLKPNASPTERSDARSEDPTPRAAEPPRQRREAERAVQPPSRDPGPKWTSSRRCFLVGQSRLPSRH
ncbi:hypothetical protein HKX48_006658, partial [Thoreauomyces humboldtii]